jgi:CheY-like chemotaxis protein
MVLDLRLPDMTGFELLERLRGAQALAEIPVVVFTGKELTATERIQLRSVAKNIVLKDVQSPERLLDETALFLHRVVSDLPEDKQAMLQRIHSSNEILRGRKVLVVDDDARNIFALTTLLENEDMEVIRATSGHMAIERITQTPDLSLVLMDIMMMDTRQSRKSAQIHVLVLSLSWRSPRGQ